ncbi:MAG TPA: hypothetical protein VGE39_10580 [Prosthecobacter sp.]
MKLSDTIGKTIGDFCGNGFDDANANHCAHFVCHVLKVGAGFTCRGFVGGSQPGACIRVQELFAVCPQVGLFANAPGGVVITFVTDRSNVNLANHTMENVPKKHVGIFSGGFVHHYSNTQDKVVRQTPKDFLARFQATYKGNQALFFGTMPPGATLPDPEDGTEAVAAPASALESLAGPQPLIRQAPAPKERTDYFATLPGAAEFYVGRSFKEGKFEGLFQPSSKLEGPRYEIANFKPQHDTAAAMLGVIAEGESMRYFNRINSYDRAAFTFGFFQLAAHTPKDNLIILFRALAAGSASFQAMFPDLKVVNGVLHRIIGSHAVSLEEEHPRPGKPSEMNLKDFMEYLNRDGAKVDNEELSAAAKLVHLANTDASINVLQVSVSLEITMGKLRKVYDPRYGLDGASDLICTAIADIHHNGRGSKAQVTAALKAGATVAQKVEALCQVGADNEAYKERCATLKKALAAAKKAGHLGVSVFDKASGLFRPASGWPE